jgi:hypothetical protein
MVGILENPGHPWCWDIMAAGITDIYIAQQMPLRMNLLDYAPCSILD